MNTLTVYTTPRLDGKYDVFWMTGENTRGVFEVTPPDLEDASVAAELAVIRHLLEVQNACGHKKTGNGLRLKVSHGAIRRLIQERSDKSHLAPYAVFLRTRFIGAAVEVEKGDAWLSHPLCADNRTPFSVAEALPELVTLGGYGEVEVTAHAIEQFGKRFCDKVEKLWARFCVAAQECVAAQYTKRRAMADARHRKIGRYALNAKRGMVFVVVPGDAEQKRMKIVTVTTGNPFVVPVSD